MEEIKIVEYTPAYARAVSEMWNRSVEGWNGEPVGRTEETVLREHENSINLQVFLVLCGDEAVGYCSFSKYAADSGALYIPLLNVRPDFHGRKVGKALVLTCVRRTIELGWPRLDLYTWPGNTKAVPLYKKCGFFWEERDDTTHLMNFIPTVLQTEAVMDYFKEADWYDDSTRLIEVKPDGRKVNGFDFLGYSWEKDSKKLRVEFERTGRGLRLIETDDYLICAGIEGHHLVFSRGYQVNYEIVNKTGRPLEIGIEGRNDQNISFAMSRSVTVAERAVVTGDFFVEAISEEQNVWRTHPSVVAELTINGKKALFKMGIVPKYPAVLNIVIPGEECFPGRDGLCYLDIESNLEEEAVFALALPEAPGLTWGETHLRAAVKAKARVSIGLNYRLFESTSFYAETAVTAQTSSGITLEFRRALGACFRGYTGALFQQTEKTWEIANGPYTVKLEINNNTLKPARLHGDLHGTMWAFPKLGKPFSPEFSRKKPDAVECYPEGGAMVLRASYSSDDFQGLRLISIAKLYAHGILQHYYEVHNESDRETPQAILLSDTLRHDMSGAVMPYDGRFLEIGDAIEGALTHWDSEKLSENWVFSYGKSITRGLTWDPRDKINFDSWSMYFEHDLGSLPAGARVQTRPITLAMDLFYDWRDFRSFAIQARCAEIALGSDDVEILINGGNPFVTEEYTIKLADQKSRGLQGRVVVSSAASAFDPQTILVDEKTAEVDLRARAPQEASVDTLGVQIDDGTAEYTRQAAVFAKRTGEVRTGMALESGLEACYAENGVLTIKAAASFAPTLYSLTAYGEEWLDSPFPNPWSAKSWWNPWIGGIETILHEISGYSLMRENIQTETADLLDKLGNAWRGIRIGVAVAKNEKYKGLVMNHYFLLLPGSNVMCHTTEIRQHTGKFLQAVPMFKMCFFKTGGDLSQSQVSWESRRSGRLKLKAGSESRFVSADLPVVYGSGERERRLLLYSDPVGLYAFPGVNNQIIGAELESRLTAADGESVFTPPLFLIFTKENLTAEMLQGLRKVRFQPNP